MTRSLITILGVEAAGRHGANEGERLEPQPFVVDLEVVVTVDDDELEATVDYRALADAAREAVSRESFALLETLAKAVASAVFQFESVEEVTATVHKPRAAESMGVIDVAVSATIR